jgi:hypothetical protein
LVIVPLRWSTNLSAVLLLLGYRWQGGNPL